MSEFPLNQEISFMGKKDVTYNRRTNKTHTRHNVKTVFLKLKKEVSFSSSSKTCKCCEQTENEKGTM